MTGSAATEQLSLEAFGHRLLETEDLDPIYVVLHRANLERDQLRRWLLAYWCCYHAGLASYLSERPTKEIFWLCMNIFASNEAPSPIGGRWPRGRERRHFRGDKAIEAVIWLRYTYEKPETAVTMLEEKAHVFGKYQYVAETVLRWPQFGPWIAFKVADMLERVMGVPIDFSDSDVFFFDSPREAAEMWAIETNHLSHGVVGVSSEAIKDACTHLKESLSSHLAPPRYDRPLNLQEFETILCKWKSHMSGSYPIGIDTRELRHALNEWKNVSGTAHRLMQVLPGVVDV